MKLVDILFFKIMKQKLFEKILKFENNHKRIQYFNTFEKNLDKV